MATLSLLASLLLEWDRDSLRTGLLLPKILSLVFNSTLLCLGGGCWTEGYKPIFAWDLCRASQHLALKCQVFERLILLLASAEAKTQSIPF